MRITLSDFRLPVLAALLLALWVSSASAINKPIPGIDIVVKKNPSNVVVKQVTTGKEGKYLIENLEPGSYTLDVQTQQKAISTSRSNIKKPDRPPVKNGVETHVVDIEFGMSKEKKAHAPVTFEVKEKSGTISGVITQEAPPGKSPEVGGAGRPGHESHPGRATP